MKETYVKPEILFESFALTQTIARDCGATQGGTLGEYTYWSEANCMWDLGDYTIFFTVAGKCDDGPEDPGDEWEFEAVCYNNPDGGTEIFSSV